MTEKICEKECPQNLVEVGTPPPTQLSSVLKVQKISSIVLNFYQDILSSCELSGSGQILFQNS